MNACLFCLASIHVLKFVSRTVAWVLAPSVAAGPDSLTPGADAFTTEADSFNTRVDSFTTEADSTPLVQKPIP